MYGTEYLAVQMEVGWLGLPALAVNYAFLLDFACAKDPPPLALEHPCDVILCVCLLNDSQDIKRVGFVLLL